jgi:hypothetical protein
MSIVMSRERTGTEACPYLANNDYAMQGIGHDLHHIQFDA